MTDHDNFEADREETMRTRRASSKRKKTGSVLPFLVGGVSSLALAAGGIYAFLQFNEAPNSATAPISTVSTTAFQEAPKLDDFKIASVDPKMQVPTNNESTKEAQLQLELDDLKRQIATLQSAAPTTVEVADTKALEKLQAQIASIETANADQMADLAKREAEAKAKIANLEADNARKNAELEGLQYQLTQAQLWSNEQNASDEAERARRATIEAKRAEAEALRKSQVTSSMVVFSGSSGSNASVQDSQDRYAGDEAFLHNGAAATVTQSEIIANPANTVIQGTLIEATLETAISSELQGNVKAVISYDVWSFDMSRVLIPRGSKLFGRYSSDVGVGQKRILVAWDRIVTTDGQSVQIESYGNDRLGRSGLTGKVDNHFFERFGSAALISTIGAVPTILASKTVNENESEVLENIGTDFGEAVGQVMADYLSIQPTIHIDHGSTVMITVNKDLELF